MMMVLADPYDTSITITVSTAIMRRRCRAGIKSETACRERPCYGTEERIEHGHTTVLLNCHFTYATVPPPPQMEQSSYGTIQPMLVIRRRDELVP